MYNFGYFMAKLAIKVFAKMNHRSPIPNARIRETIAPFG